MTRQGAMCEQSKSHIEHVLEAERSNVQFKGAQLEQSKSHIEAWPGGLSPKELERSR